MTVPGFNDKPEYGEPLIGEFWIDYWEQADDSIPASRMSEFFTWEQWSALVDDFPGIEWFDICESTRFGGSPRWTGNGPLSAPIAPFEFLLQLTTIHFEGSAPPADAVGCPIHTSATKDGRAYHHSNESPTESRRKPNSPWHLSRTLNHPGFFAEYTNFGSDGTAYVFIDRAKHPHDVQWYWNR